MTNNKQQPKKENPNNQFSNSEPMTFAQKVDYIKNINMTNNKQQTAVEQLFVKMLDIQESCNQLTFDEYSELLNKYHEIEKNQAINFALDCHGMTKYQIEEHYIKTYGLYL